jgi:hypothetical protein
LRGLKALVSFDRAFDATVGSHVDSVSLQRMASLPPNFRRIAALALQNRLPSIGAKEYAEAGGLIGYAANILALYRRAAYFVEDSGAIDATRTRSHVPRSLCPANAGIQYAAAV